MEQGSTCLAATVLARVRMTTWTVSEQLTQLVILPLPGVDEWGAKEIWGGHAVVVPDITLAHIMK